MSSMKVDFSGLKKLYEKFTNNPIKEAFRSVAKEKAVAALIGQAIADNFDKEGPGWQPLKTETIRRSVAKKLGRELASMTDAQIRYHEVKARSKAATEEPYRRILQRTGLLKKTATKVGFTGSTTKKKNGDWKNARSSFGPQRGVSVTGSNIYKVENFNIIWGTNLPYASKHNNGEGVPKREFLVIRKEWQARLDAYVLSRVKTYFRNAIRGGT